MTILGTAKPSVLGTEKPLVLGTRKPRLGDGGDPIRRGQGTSLELPRKPLMLTRMFQIFTLTPFVIFSQREAAEVGHYTIGDTKEAVDIIDIFDVNS